ncbi:MAG: putative metal-binding motif-containing protein [Pseudomonadota bacterium]
MPSTRPHSLLLLATLGCGPDKTPDDTGCPGGEPTTWYLDADGDGFGDPASGALACAPGSGQVADGSDCDDTDPQVHPGADERCDGVDDDCDGDIDEDDAVDAGTWYADVDADGWGDAEVTVVACGPSSTLAEVAGDCDDSDPAAHPGAYERPNDGTDQDCDGQDRSFEGVVLDYGNALAADSEVTLDDPVSGYDVAVLFDTTSSMTLPLMAFDIEAVDAARSTSFGSVQYGFATFDDYAWGSMGQASSGDLPFLLRQQVTDDLPRVDYAVHSASTHYGGDTPEAAVEALHQALAGTGYDQGCDGVYDATTDVLPWLASAIDPFGGVGGQAWDDLSPGGGPGGGMGFRDDAVPILAYVTDAALRDPDAGYETPGGCPGDAGSTQVVAQALDLGAWLVGLAVSGTSASPAPQMEDLAQQTGSLADLDGDGTTEPLVREDLDASDLNRALAQAITAIDREVSAATTCQQVWLVVASDPWSMVADIQPAPHTQVKMADWPVTFTVTWVGTLAPTEDAQQIEVTFDLIGDGTVIGSAAVAVEVPPR